MINFEEFTRAKERLSRQVKCDPGGYNYREPVNKDVSLWYSPRTGWFLTLTADFNIESSHATTKTFGTDEKAVFEFLKESLEEEVANEVEYLREKLEFLDSLLA